MAIMGGLLHDLAQRGGPTHQYTNCTILTHSLTAALDQLRVAASSTSNDPGPRSRQHQQIQLYNTTVQYTLLKRVTSYRPIASLLTTGGSFSSDFGFFSWIGNRRSHWLFNGNLDFYHATRCIAQTVPWQDVCLSVGVHRIYNFQVRPDPDPNRILRFWIRPDPDPNWI